jgi:chemotaxis signal transduction protein
MTTTGGHQFCTFYLDRLLFGVESQKIQEVVTYRELRPVPLAPPVVSGLTRSRSLWEAWQIPLPCCCSRTGRT